MARMATLAAIGVTAIVGVGLGVHLGNAAAGSIRPGISAPPPTRAYAATLPQRPVSAGYASYTFPEPYRPAVIQDDYLDDGYAASTDAYDGYRDPEPAEVEDAAVELPPAPDFEEVERYTSYPVTAEKPERALATGSGEPDVIVAEEATGALDPPGF